MSCLFWPGHPAAFWLTRAPSCLGDGAEPDGFQAPASTGRDGEGALGRGMLWGPSPGEGSQLQAGVHQEELGLHGAFTCMYIYMSAP